MLALDYSASLAAARSEALASLLKLLRESVSETQIRLAAAAILRLPEPAATTEAPARAAATERPPATPAAPAPAPTCAPRPSRGDPLAFSELAELCLILPHVDPKRFLTKHTPNYWRDAIAAHHRMLAKSQAAQPPPSPARAA